MRRDILAESELQDNKQALIVISFLKTKQSTSYHRLDRRNILSIVVFILIFSVVVFSHELGHFLLARRGGIKVNEFTIGMGPVIWKRQGKICVYSLRLFPIGGACMFEGEDGKTTDVEKKNETLIEKTPVESVEMKDTKSGNFQDASVWVRISTVVAGPLFNLLLAFLLSLILVGFSGTDLPVVTDVMEGFPAQEAGVLPGDRIISMNNQRIHLYREVSLISYANRGEEIEIVYSRNGEERQTVITPKLDSETGRYYIGFMGAGEFVKCNPIETIQYSFYEVRYWLISTVKSLGMLVEGKVSTSEMAGPVGIAQVIDTAIDETAPYGLGTVMLTILNIAILLSVNLGVINLMPLPALDGGRLVFMLIELVRGKPVPPEKEGIVHLIGFVALMLLMVFVLYNDIARIFG